VVSGKNRPCVSTALRVTTPAVSSCSTVLKIFTGTAFDHCSRMPGELGLIETDALALVGVAFGKALSTSRALKARLEEELRARGPEHVAFLVGAAFNLRRLATLLPTA
jgi:hypothetical protein